MTARRIDHAEAAERFSPYVDRELEPAQEREFLLHLETCPACRQEYEAFARALALLRGAERVRPRPGFERRVAKKLRTRRRRAPGPSPTKVALLVSAEAAVPLLIALGVAVLLVLLAP
jgi:anti-sigma factor RsiW